jgi:DNA-directed RNA polymerase subunit RPC12/RpoP
MSCVSRILSNPIGALKMDRTSVDVFQMAHVQNIKCTSCIFSYRGELLHAYVMDALGHREYCRHPGQEEHACEILGIDHNRLLEAMAESSGYMNSSRKYMLPDGVPATACDLVGYFESRCGITKSFVCTSCQSVSDLDERRDVMQCSDCGSEGIFSIGYLAGRECPICRAGLIVMDPIGIV